MLLSAQRKSRSNAAFLHLRVHLGLEEPQGTASLGLGPVERKIGIAHQKIGVHRIVAADGDANAGADHHLLVTDVVALVHQLDDALRQRAGFGRLAHLSLQNREFVATHARDHIIGSDKTAQPLGDHGQQLVAGGMAERIVDIFEVVEVEQVPGDHGSGLGMTKRLPNSIRLGSPVSAS